MQQLMQRQVDRSAAGRGYMGGGALGLVSLGRAEAGDTRGLTLNIRHQVRGEGHPAWLVDSIPVVIPVHLIEINRY